MDSRYSFFSFKYFWSLLRVTWKAFEKNPWIYFLLIVLIQGAGLFVLYFFLQQRPEVLSILEAGNLKELVKKDINILYQLTATIVAVNLIFSSAMQLLSFSIIFFASSKNKKLSAKEIIKKAPGLLWVNFLCITFIALGFFMFVLPSIILAYYLFLAGAVYLVEEKKGLEALKASAGLMRLKGGEIIFNAALSWLFVSFITSFYVGLPFRAGQIISAGFTNIFFFGVIYLIIFNQKTETEKIR
jgi:hypothetical protein